MSPRLPTVRTTLFAAACLGLTGGARAQDFNGNAVRDSVDLRNGTSRDCNLNGVPDEAEFDKPGFAAAVEHFGDAPTLSAVAGVAAFDADRDGDTDVATSSGAGSPSNSNLTIWRNDGGPGLVFGSRTLLTNAQCAAVRAADLNGDGLLDLAASDSGFAQVIVMLATGPGTFAAPTRFPAVSRGTGLAVADLDGDRDADLAVTGSATNTVEVFLNQGNGVFPVRRTFAVGQQPAAVAAADFTGDGLADLAVANSFVSFPGTGTVTLLRNTGGGVLAAQATLAVEGHPETSLNSTPHDVALADIDGDRDADLLVSSKDSNSLRIYGNDGAGGFTQTQTLGPLEPIGGAADRFLCTDLDGDAGLELAWCDSAARAVRIYDNRAGAFEFARSYAACAEGPVALAAGDFTSDATTDLVLAGATSNAFSTMVGLGDLAFSAVNHLRRPDLNFYPVLADFTGDGVTDLASYATFDTPTTFRIAPGLGDGRFGEARIVPLPSAAPLLPRDLDGDRDLDILGLGNSGNRYAKLNNGDGTFGDPIFSDPISVHGNHQTADINNDGHLDMLWSWSVASNQPHFIRISLGDGRGHFAPYYEVQTPPFLGSVWTGDLTGDGFPELFVGVAAGIVGPLGYETVLVYPNNGDGTFGAFEVHAYELLPNFAGGIGAFAWVDIDRDGDKDLLGQGTYTWWYPNTGHRLEAPVQLGGFANYAYNEFGPTIYDLDEDGDLDFYGSASINGVTSPAAFFNDGSGGFGPRLALQRYRNRPDAIAIGDADNNGRPDILVKAQGHGDWYLHLNFAREARDCNANGTPDSCDIASGFSQDLNSNGVPDECEACYADCDTSTGPGVLDIFDFLCFQNRYDAGDPYACDCDTGGGPGVCDIFDFLCFQNAYAAGCP